MFSRKLLRENLGEFVPIYWSGLAYTVHTNTIQKFYTFAFIFTTCFGRRPR